MQSAELTSFRQETSFFIIILLLKCCTLDFKHGILKIVYNIYIHKILNVDDNFLLFTTRERVYLVLFMVEHLTGWKDQLNILLN